MVTFRPNTISVDLIREPEHSKTLRCYETMIGTAGEDSTAHAEYEELQESILS